MDEPKKRGPHKQYGGREDMHLKLPTEIAEYIDSVTVNRTKWLIEAAMEKMERERSNGVAQTVPESSLSAERG